MDISDFVCDAWKGLFRVLQSSSSERCLDSACQWYESEAMSKYGCQPQWIELLDTLLKEEPVIQNKILTFQTIFHQLSPRIQTTLLLFFLHYRNQIPKRPMKEFITEIHLNVEEDSWQDAHLRMLAAHIQTQECDNEFQISMPGQCSFTSKNKELAASVCQKLKLQKETSVCLWCFDSSFTEDENKRIGIMDCRMDNIEKTEQMPSTKISSAAPDIQSSNEEESMEVICLDDEEEFNCKKLNLSNSEEITTSETVNVNHAIKSTNTLDQTTMDKINKLLECWLAETGAEVLEELDIFYTSTPNQVVEYCKYINFKRFSETSLKCACQHFLSVCEIVSHDNCVQFLNSAILPQFDDPCQSASRQFLNLLKSVAEKIPTPLIDGVFIPYLLSKNIGTTQTEVICKVMKDSLQSSIVTYFIRNVIDAPAELCESSICIYQTAFELKVQLNHQDILQILNMFKKSSSLYQKNLKFGKMLFAFVNVFGEQMEEEHLSVVQLILQTHSSFLKKSIDSALKKFHL